MLVKESNDAFAYQKSADLEGTGFTGYYESTSNTFFVPLSVSNTVNHLKLSATLSLGSLTFQGIDSHRNMNRFQHSGDTIASSLANNLVALETDTSSVQRLPLLPTP